jgi:hypothetical protein
MAGLANFNPITVEYNRYACSNAKLHSVPKQLSRTSAPHKLVSERFAIRSAPHPASAFATVRIDPCYSVDD